VLELDVPGDGHAVVGDRRRAPLLVQDDVAPLGTEGHLHRVGEGVDATLQGAPSLLVERKDLRHGFSSSDHLVTTARMSRALSSSSSLPSYLTSVPPYLLKITTSPSATSSGTRLPLSSIRPGPVERTLPSCGFSFAVSGMTRPDAVVCSASSGSMRIRSSSGLIVTATFKPLSQVMCSVHGMAQPRRRRGSVSVELAHSVGECQPDISTPPSRVPTPCAVRPLSGRRGGGAPGTTPPGRPSAGCPPGR